MRRSVLLAALAAALPAVAAAQDRPPEWRLVTDRPAADSAVSYVGMPPGWHITTGPGSLLFADAYRAAGHFAVEAEVFLFPGESQEGYGVFVGGGPGSAPGHYVAFLLRRDGSAAVEHRADGRAHAVVPWARHEAIAPGKADGAVRNVLRVDTGPEWVTFLVNGQSVARVARAELPVDGLFGFRVGEAVNLHVSRLDHVVHLAPIPSAANPRHD